MLLFFNSTFSAQLLYVMVTNVPSAGVLLSDGIEWSARTLRPAPPL